MSQPLILLLHPVHAPITELEAKSALSEEDRMAFSRAVVLEDARFTRGDTVEIDWLSAQQDLAREFIERVKPELDRGARFAYFGLAPIPLAMQLGYLLEDWSAIDVHQRRHTREGEVSFPWRWESRESTISVNVSASHALVALNVPGDVIVRVSTWHEVDANATRALLPSGPLFEIDITINRPGADSLASRADLLAVARCFREQLDAISDALPQATIHVFAAVPVGLALELGRAVSPTKHRPVQTYQFNSRETPQQRRAFVLQDFGGDTIAPLTDEERDAAAAACELWNAELAELAARAGAGSEPWTRVLRIDSRHDWSTLPPLRLLAPYFGHAEIDAALLEFEFDRESPGRWRLSPQLVLAMHRQLRDDEQRRVAIRLFVLHEGLHLAHHGIGPETANRVGRLPRVLEELDYEADAWAMLQEIALEVSKNGESGAVAMSRRLVEASIATFWAFDRGEKPMREIQVRRLNRYLIWYWQALRLERAQTLDDVVDVLLRKPVLEVAGLRTSVARERVVFSLDHAPDDLELGVVEEHVLERRPNGLPYRIRDLVEGFRVRDAETVKRALRGVFDNVTAKTRPTTGLAGRPKEGGGQ